MSYRSIALDRILEIAGTPGTGNVTLGGAVLGYRSFASVMTAGDTCAYFLEATDRAGVLTGLWERGFGTFLAGNTFARSVVLDGSNGSGVIVNFTTSVRIGCAPMTDTISNYPDPGGRLSVSSTSAVFDGPTAGSGTIYYVPYLHDRIALWNGSGIQVVQFAATSLNVPIPTGGSGFDVFGYVTYVAPNWVLNLEALIWASITGRATGINYQNGFLCKAADPTRRYLGSFFCGLAGLIFDFPNGGGIGLGGKRFLWNMYNRVPRLLYMYDNTGSWTYGTNAWRIIRGSFTPIDGVEMFRGLNEDVVSASGSLSIASVSGTQAYSMIGLDGGLPGMSSSSPILNTGATTVIANITSSYSGLPGMGYHALQLLENAAIGTPTFGNGSSNGLYTSVMA